jgi:hypothetical protein
MADSLTTTLSIATVTTAPAARVAKGLRVEVVPASEETAELA